MSRFSLGFTVFELPSELKDEFLLLPYGRHDTVDGEQGFEFDPADAQSAIAAFKDRGTDLLTDWEHQSIAHLPGFEGFKSPDGRAPAAGWNGNLEARDTGLWATKVRWTPQAVEALKTGAYRYYSPVLFLADGHARGIHTIALTNEPRIKNVPALAARCDLGELLDSFERSLSMPNLATLLAGALALKADASDQDVLGAVTALKDKAAAGETAAGQIAAFKTQAESGVTKLAELQTKLEAATADATVKAGELAAFKTASAADKAVLVDTILSFAESTGRIKPADKATWKPIVEGNPTAGLAAFKLMTPGSAVPVGRVTGSEGAGPTPADPLAAYKGAGFDPKRMELHTKALAYADTHKVPYDDALLAVQKA